MKLRGASRVVVGILGIIFIGAIVGILVSWVVGAIVGVVIVLFFPSFPGAQYAAGDND